MVGVMAGADERDNEKQIAETSGLNQVKVMADNKKTLLYFVNRMRQRAFEIAIEMSLVSCPRFYAY